MQISVITINYNNLYGLKATLKSVEGQRGSSFEHIIIDGASSDGSKGVIIDYCLKRKLVKWLSEPDCGIYDAMNKGVGMASGEYCIFLNSGDTFINSTVIQRISKYIDGKYDVISGCAIYIKDGSIKWYRKPPRNVTLQYLYKTSICHQATFIKKSFLLAFPYDTSLRLVSDWKFWLQTIGRGIVSYLAVNEDVCCFDMNGIGNIQKKRGLAERQVVFAQLLTKEQITELNNQECICSLSKTIKDFCYRVKRKLYLIYARLFMKKKIEFYP